MYLIFNDRISLPHSEIFSLLQDCWIAEAMFVAADESLLGASFAQERNKDKHYFSTSTSNFSEGV